MKEDRDTRLVKIEYRNKTCLHSPMDYAKTLILPFRVGDLDMLETRVMAVVEERKMHRCARAAKQ